MNAKQAKMPQGSVMAAIVQAVTIGEQLKAELAPLLATIEAQAAKQIEAKNVSDDAKTEAKGLWGNILTVAEHVAAAAPSKDTRQMVFDIVAAGLLESENSNTAKMYASTARNVLVKLHTEQGKTFEELHDASYPEIRKLLKPDANPEATARLAELNKALKLVIRKSKKEDVSALFDLLQNATDELYRPLKQAQDKDKAAAKAAAELESNRQQAPAEPAATETVAKPEAVAA